MSVSRPFHILLLGNAADAGRLEAALAPLGGDFNFSLSNTAAGRNEFARRLQGEPPDVVVVGPSLVSPLNVASRFRQVNPRCQIVFLLAPERLERVQTALPFAPHLGSAWALSVDISAEELRTTLQEAAHTARERAGTEALFSRINVKLASGRRSAEANTRTAQLALSERYLATILQQSPNALLAVDLEGRLLAWNAAAIQLFSIKSEDALGGPAAALFPPECHAELDRLIEAAGREESIVTRDMPLRTLGSEVAADGEISLAPVHDDAGRIVSISITARDVTARKRAERALRELNQTLEERVEQAVAERAEMEEALRHAQKMEAIGQLTGGIAHDFNNMLAVVIGSLDLLRRHIGGAEPRSLRHLEAAADAARRAAILTQRLLAFARRQPLKPESVNVNKLVAGMSELVRHSLGADIRLETVLAGGLWRTFADPNQLESALLNIAVNARDAMPDGGRLTIETQNAYLDARYAAAHLGVSSGQYVLIAVTDTGAGMPPDIAEKAFDPFFTTKGVGKGTGLGLSQVYGFVKQSGGHVKIYSEPGEGTTVKVYLPRLVGSEGDVTEPVEAPDLLPRGEARELVLVVEDEPSVRQFSVDALVELGYRVLEADGAAAALRLLEAHPDIALLFTDIVMPDVNGRRLADEALQRRPDLKILFTTGYTQNAVVHNGILDPGLELITKPFTIEELAAKIRDMLDAR